MKSFISSYAEDRIWRLLIRSGSRIRRRTCDPCNPMQRGRCVDLVKNLTLLLNQKQDILHRGCIHKVALDVLRTLYETDAECCPCAQISVDPEFLICSFAIFQAQLVQL